MTNNLIKLSEWGSESKGIRRIRDIIEEEMEHIVEVDLDIPYLESDDNEGDDSSPFNIAMDAIRGMIIEALGGKYAPEECRACILMDQVGKDPIHDHIT